MYNFSEINTNELENINAGSVGSVIGVIGTAITVYEAIEDFSTGFAIFLGDKL